MKRHPILLLLGAVSALAAPRPRVEPPVQLEPYARVQHSPLDEMSGIVKSRRYRDTFWVHNDSGDVPRLFAIHRDGGVIVPSWLADRYYAGEPVAGKEPYPGVRLDLAANFDWEDIAIDGSVLYIADTGNNGNARRDLGVYVLTEPNPAAIDRARVATWLPVAFPDQKAYPGTQWRFDCEAIFIYRHELYFLTKYREGASIGLPGSGSTLYRLDSGFTNRVNILTKVESRPDLGGWVTAADMSPDGRTLAVLCQAPVASVWLFEPLKGDRFLSGRARRLVLAGARQCEGICFDGPESLLVTNEDRDIFRLSVGRFQKAPR